MALISVSFMLLSFASAAVASSGGNDLKPMGIPKVKGTQKNFKLGSQLSKLLKNGRRSSMNATSPGDEEMIRVMAELVPNAELDATGLNIESRAGNMVQISATPTGIEMLSESQSVRYIHLPVEPHTLTVSEGVELINADNFHAENLTGENIKIAVIDSGFKNYSSNPEVPDNNVIEAKSFRRSDNDIEAGQEHGTACAEVIVDMAPDAGLYLLNFDTSLEFSDAVSYAIEQDVDIISSSVGWVNMGPYDGTGFINDQVENAYQHGIFWAQAAGNQAQRHYEGAFTDDDDDNFHEYGENDEILNLGSLDPGSIVSLYLSWDDWPDSDQDYDLYLYKEVDSGWTVVDNSLNPQTGFQPPRESIEYIPSSQENLGVRIHSFDTNKNAHLELYSFHNDFPEYNVTSSSLIIPADEETATTVGATYWGNDGLEYFSSRGPTNDGRTKPDVTGPDEVSNSVYGNFYGTSASAPHVAGAAALILSEKPSTSVDGVENRLKSNAVDLGPSGPDNDYGWGRIDLNIQEPVLRSVDSGGSEVNTYNLTDNVYMSAENLEPGTTYHINIVDNIEWTEGENIEGDNVSPTVTVTTDENGGFGPKLVWDNPDPGYFDVIADDGGDLYSSSSDGLDDMDIGGAGLFVVPEPASVLILFTCLGALFLLVKFRKR